MAKVKVEVLDAIVGGHKRGAVISVDEKAAKQLEANYYVKRVEEKADKKSNDGKKESGE